MKFSFETMPQGINVLLHNQTQHTKSINLLQKSILELKESLDRANKLGQNEWFSVQTLSDYLPEHPAIQTIYGWVNRKEIPYSKRGKALQFNKAEIDKWIREGGCKNRRRWTGIKR